MAQFLDEMERIKTIRIGEKTKPTFSKEEMTNRNAKLHSYMGEKDIDAVLFTSYHNVNYYADYLYTSFGRHTGLVVTQDKHITITPNVDGGMPWRKCFGDNLSHTDWRRDNFFYAVQTVLKDAGITKGRLGIEYDFVTLSIRQQLENSFPEFEFVDVAFDLMKFRMVKSKEELDLITNGARVCDVGGYAVAEAIAEGVPEYEVALAGTEAMTREIAKLYPHADLRDSWVWFQSGIINTDGAHTWPTTRKIQPGDVLNLNTFAMIAGYYTALERTLFFQDVDEASLKYWNINVEVLEAGSKLIKPGAVCKDIANELNKIYKNYGVLSNRTFGYGHSFGILSHYYGREAGLELREDIDTVFEPGMTISMEPMILIPEGQPGAGGYREHDILIIHENGEAENVTKFPYGPEHNIIKR